MSLQETKHTRNPEQFPAPHDPHSCTRENTPACTPEPRPRRRYPDATAIRSPLSLRCVSTEARSALSRTRRGKRPTRLLPGGRGEFQGLCPRAWSARRDTGSGQARPLAFQIPHPVGRVALEEGPRQESHGPSLIYTEVWMKGVWVRCGPRTSAPHPHPPGATASQPGQEATELPPRPRNPTDSLVAPHRHRFPDPQIPISLDFESGLPPLRLPPFDWKRFRTPPRSL